MDINKVNATLSKAISHIRDREVDDLMGAVAESEDAGGDENIVTEYVSGLVDQVVESKAADFDKAFETVTGVISDLAESNPVSVKTEADLDAWAEEVGLAKAIAQRLAA